jgi:hypothetical protein
MDVDRRRGKWVARWRDADRKQHSQAFDRKMDAERHLTKIKSDLMRSVYIDPRAGLVTVREYAEARWLPAQLHLRPNSAAMYASHVNTWVVPLLGDRPLGGLRRPDCTSFVAALSAQLAASTVATVYAVFRSLVQSAVEDGLIAANPPSRVPLPRVDQTVIVPMPEDSVTALAAAITARYEVTAWLAAGAGLREGEAPGPIVRRVDFLHRRLHVHQQMQNRQLSPRKTKASMRTVPVDDLVLSKIAAHVQGQRTSSGELLVTNRLGKPVQRNSFGHC